MPAFFGSDVRAVERQSQATVAEELAVMKELPERLFADASSRATDTTQRISCSHNRFKNPNDAVPANDVKVIARSGGGDQRTSSSPPDVSVVSAK